MRFASFVVGGFLAILGGCLYWDQGKTVCNKETPGNVPALALVNPDTLQCQTFSSGIPCDPACGLCPAGATADIAPAIPTWGACGSACAGLDQTHCAATSGCRVAHDWAEYYSSAASDFLGCFPDDMVVDTSRTPCAGRAAQSCTQSAQCAALYQTQAGSEQFKECIPKDQVAGSCSGSVICALAKPACPTGTTPGIKDGCWTDACIPTQFCPQK